VWLELGAAVGGVVNWSHGKCNLLSHAVLETIPVYIAGLIHSASHQLNQGVAKQGDSQVNGNGVTLSDACTLSQLIVAA